ncbi:MAG: DUF1592 domain-containing protein [Calothrix sp. SM1_5_4]|nr:DUF1592 domain-containing protein [Calothrix sp. SM1_5_4]
MPQPTDFVDQARRSAAQIMASLAGIPSMTTIRMTAEEVEAVALALKTKPDDPQANPFFCQASAQPSEHRLQRLAKSEYVNTIADLFRGVVATAEISAELALVPEESNSNNPYDRGADSMSLGLVQAHSQVAAKIAGLISANTTKMNSVFSESCFTQASVSDACINQFLDRFGRRVFRRPIKTEERVPLVKAYRIGSSRAENSGFLLQALLMSPNFLYHLEFDGTPVDGTASAYRLSAYELASRLSYLIVNSMPDDALFAAAADNSLMTAAGYEAQMNRLFTLPAAKTSLRRFFQTWFNLSRIREPAYSTAVKAGIDTNGINEAAAEEALLFIDHVIFENKPLAALLLDNTAFIKSPALAQIYGVSMPTTADGRVSLPPPRGPAS